MRVFVFQPNNAPVGRFEVDRIEDLASGLEAFRRVNHVEVYDFLECAGRTWTVVAGPGGYELVEGKVGRSESAVVAGAPPPPLLARYRRGYRVGAAAVGFGKALAAVGWILGVLTIIAGLLTASGLPADAVLPAVIYAIVVGVLQVVVFMFFGMLVTALGEILRASLDTAVHTSPFLDEEQKSQAIEAGIGKR